ncbi:MAG: ABC transporter substrate-binding protein [Desulfovibrionaceae bacterium]|nr:ABC transporter substrate-binding protein [Desulfovibrionaceae bacterium]
MWKKILCLFALICMLAAPAQARAGEKPKITIYTSMYEDVIEAMSNVLKKKFPAYDIEFFYGGTGTLQAKIAAERDAKKLGCDMLMLADPSYALELKKDGILHAYLSKEAKNLALEYDTEGYWYPVRICNMVLAYNPRKYKKAALPQSFQEFAQSATLKSACSMPNPLTAGTALVSVSALKDKYGYAYFDQLAANKIMVESGSVALTKLETGECKEIMILEESVLKKREEEKSPLEVIYPKDGCIIISSPIMTVKDSLSAHGNTKICEELTDWFLSEEGQRYIVKGWMHSVLQKEPAIPFDSMPTRQIIEKAIPVNWEHCLQERADLRKNFEERVKKSR